MKNEFQIGDRVATTFYVGDDFEMAQTILHDLCTAIKLKTHYSSEFSLYIILDEAHILYYEEEYYIEGVGTIFDEITFTSEKASNIPCALCGGECIEFVVPNDIWNKIMRPDGKETDKEYICATCWEKKILEYSQNKQPL